jgi:hypothetical protein
VKDTITGIMRVLVIVACAFALARPAHAEKVSLTCSGVSYYYRNSNSSGRDTMQEHDIPVVIDLDRGVVTGPLMGAPREFPITKSNDVEIHFAGGLAEGSHKSHHR